MKNHPQHNKWIYIWAGLSILYAIIIHFLFKIPGPVCLQAKWGAGDILTYASTISLGLLALWQNEKIQAVQAVREEHALAVDHYPLFEVSNCEALFYSSTEPAKKSCARDMKSGFNGNTAFWKLSSQNELDTLKIILNIKNIGNTPATGIRIEDKNGNQAENTNVSSPNFETNTQKHIQSNSSGEILLNICMDNLKREKKIVYNLTFCNPFGAHYQQPVTVSLRSGLIVYIDVGCCVDIILTDK